MKIFFNKIYKVADRICKILTPSEEEAARMVERYKAVYGIYLDNNYK
jgi:hypothetical protein